MYSGCDGVTAREVSQESDPLHYFTSLPVYHLLSYYPAVYPSATNDFRIPIIEDAGEPDLRLAALSRAAELSMVSYDTNAYESQLLQGWLMRDQFLMRGPFGVTYELLWANPYQPALSYYSAPLVHHDPLRGRLLLRSGWDSDASWFYHGHGVMQTFEDGRKVMAFGSTSLGVETRPAVRPRRKPRFCLSSSCSWSCVGPATPWRGRTSSGTGPRGLRCRSASGGQ